MANITSTLVYGNVDVDVAINPTTVHVELQNVVGNASLGVQDVPAGTVAVVFPDIVVPPTGMDIVGLISNLDQTGKLIGAVVTTPVLNIPPSVHSVSVVVSGALTAA